MSATLTPRTGYWPPGCAMPQCDRPALPSSGRAVRFPTGRRYVDRLCAICTEREREARP